MNILIGEILGTFALVLLGTATVAAVSLKKSPANGAGWVFIALGWGMGVFAGIVIATPFSGAHLNPAVSFAFYAIGDITLSQLFIYLIAEMIGAFLGAFVTFILYYDFFKATEDQKTILGVFSTSPTIENPVRNILSETVGTFILVLFILMTTVSENISMLFVPMLVVGIGIALGSLTGYAINPARDLGPRLFHAIMPLKHKGDSNWKYSYVPIFGPILGGLLAAGTFSIIITYL